MDENNINFAEVITRDTFEGLKNICTAFLKLSGLNTASLEFPDVESEEGDNKNLLRVYLRSQPDELSIHIVSGTAKVDDLPQTEKEDIEDFENGF